MLIGHQDINIMADGKHLLSHIPVTNPSARGPLAKLSLNKLSKENCTIHEATLSILLHHPYICGMRSDEPPHQICSYTLLFSLFLHFPYIANPPLHTSAPTRLHALARQSHSLYWTNLAYLMDIWLTIHMYLLLFLASPTCPLLRSDQSWGLAPRSQALSIASPYARILVYHSYLTCLYLPLAREHHRRSPNQLPTAGDKTVSMLQGLGPYCL